MTAKSRPAGAVSLAIGPLPAIYVPLSPGTAPKGQRRDQQDDNRSDQGTQHATPVEDVGITDAKANREDEVADQGSDQAQHEGNEPGQRSAHVPEGIARNNYAGYDSAEKAEQEGSEHYYSWY
jgi:hypothetical protein